MRTKLFLFLLLGLVLSSCVVNRKYLYFQKDDLGKKNHDNADTAAARTYSLENFDYKVQPQDIISVRFQSLTQEGGGDQSMQQSSLQNALSPGTSTSSGNMAMVTGALLLGDIVDEHGEIPVPVVGKVKVAGLSIFQIQDTLQSIANKYLESPVVKVRLLNYRATILGAVLQEGHITFPYNRVSLPEAIGMAGGLDDLADRSNIKIIRQHGAKAEVYYVNLLDENFFKSPFYYVHQNDVIIVPPLKQRPFRKYFGQNFSIFLSSVSLLLLVITLSNK